MQWPATAGKAIGSGLRWNSVFLTQKQFLNSNSKTGVQDPPVSYRINRTDVLMNSFTDTQMFLLRNDTQTLESPRNKQMPLFSKEQRKNKETIIYMAVAARGQQQKFSSHF